jgi:hypothetical protein
VCVCIGINIVQPYYEIWKAFFTNFLYDSAIFELVLMSLGGGGGGRARVSLLHPFDLIVVKVTHSTLCIGIAEHAV